jgi:hypothetical protein
LICSSGVVDAIRAGLLEHPVTQIVQIALLEQMVEESEVILKPFPEMTSPCKAISVAASFPAGREVKSRA